jgi:hypothetical protein
MMRSARTMPLFTPDGRYLVVRGRLWRASNPALASADRERHTRELMTARRAVREALASRDRDAEKSARRAVHAAKVALGERGPVWWNDGSPDLNRRMIENTEYSDWWRTVTAIRATTLGLLHERAANASVCPSEVARTVKPQGWRALMPVVRDVAREMAREGIVAVTQKGHALSTDETWRGPIRITLTSE